MAKVYKRWLVTSSTAQMRGITEMQMKQASERKKPLL
jgi:hypothetical protein